MPRLVERLGQDGQLAGTAAPVVTARRQILPPDVVYGAAHHLAERLVARLPDKRQLVEVGAQLGEPGLDGYRLGLQRDAADNARARGQQRSAPWIFQRILVIPKGYNNLRHGFLAEQPAAPDNLSLFRQRAVEHRS